MATNKNKNPANERPQAQPVELAQARPVEQEQSHTAKKESAKNLSAVNAKAAFTNFTLSKLSKDKPSRHYIAKGDNVTEAQNALIQKQLEDFKPTGPGLTLTISDPEVLNINDGEMELSQLITAMEKARKGAEFYTAGSSVIEQLNIQNRVDEMMKQIKKKSKNG